MIGGKSYLVSQYQINGINLGDLSKIKDIVTNGEKLCIIPLSKEIPSDSKRPGETKKSDPMVSPGLLISPPGLIASPDSASHRFPASPGLPTSPDPMVSSDSKYPGPLIHPEPLDVPGTGALPLPEQPSSYLKDCVHKIIRGKRYFVPVDSKNHGSLLNLVCEFRHSSKQHILSPGIPLYDFYFKDQKFLVKTMIKIGIHWFIEFH